MQTNAFYNLYLNSRPSAKCVHKMIESKAAALCRSLKRGQFLVFYIAIQVTEGQYIHILAQI